MHYRRRINKRSIRSAMPSTSKHCKKKANWNLPLLIFVLSALASRFTSKRSNLLARSLYETSCRSINALSIFFASSSWFVMTAGSSFPSLAGLLGNYLADLQFTDLIKQKFINISSYIRILCLIKGNGFLCDFYGIFVSTPLENNFKDRASWGAEVQN